MSPFDREAALKAAENTLTLGKVDAAIAEYAKIAEAQPPDWNSANTLGDLCVRSNRLERGLEQYTRIADHLAAGGAGGHEIDLTDLLAEPAPAAASADTALPPTPPPPRSLDQVFRGIGDKSSRASSEEAAAEQYRLALTYHEMGMVGEDCRALAVFVELESESGGYLDVAGQIERLSKALARG